MKGTQFHCVKFRLGSAGEPTICSHCYSVPYMKIPANNQVIFVPNWPEMCRRIESPSIIAHLVNFDIQREGWRKYDAKISIYSYICILILSMIDIFSLSIDNTKNHVATLTCLEWHTVKICWHFQYRLIDNVCDYLYLKESEKENFKFEVDPHQFDLRLHHFSQFPFNVKKKKSWQVGDWLAKWLISCTWVKPNPRWYEYISCK